MKQKCPSNNSFRPQTPPDENFGNDLELPPCELDSKEEGK